MEVVIGEAESLSEAVMRALEAAGYKKLPEDERPAWLDEAMVEHNRLVAEVKKVQDSLKEYKELVEALEDLRLALEAVEQYNAAKERMDAEMAKLAGNPTIRPFFKSFLEKSKVR